MDDIAKEAGYSKATLYVYFANKEEIISFLVLKSMKMLHTLIIDALTPPITTKEKYSRICKALTQYQEQYPLYFTFALGEININFDKEDYLLIEKEIYLQTVFLFWGSLAGVIQMAVNKQSYIQKTMNQSKQQFLEFGFEKLYHLIVMEEKNKEKITCNFRKPA